MHSGPNSINLIFWGHFSMIFPLGPSQGGLGEPPEKYCRVNYSGNRSAQLSPMEPMKPQLVIIFLIIIGRGHARPDSTPRRPASAACGCTRQDRGAFAALQGLSGTVACLDTTARSVDKDKAARRSQPIVAWAMTWSLPMAVADRCRWPLPIVQLLLVGRPAVDNEREVICAAF